MSYDPIERIRRQQALLDRLRPPDLVPMRLLERIQQPSYATALTNALQDLNRRSALFEAAQSNLARPAMLEQLEALRRPTGEIQRLAVRALQPDQSGLAKIAESMAKQVALFKTASMVETSWSRLLRQQMAAVRTPWLDPHLTSLSFEGFAVISRLSQAVRYAEPLDEIAREQIDEDLGDPIEVEEEAGPDKRDAAHIEAGMNATMLTISPAAIGDVLIQTGLVFKPSYAPLPVTTDGSDPGNMFHPGHHMIITTVEQKLRATIESRMRKKYGERWIETRINPQLLQEWTTRRDAAVSKGESPLDLIQYAYFMELSDLIVRRDHWREIFRPIFGKKEHFLTSMERLHPIRHPLAHSRPIGIGQQFHLISEAAYILRALGIDIFENP